MKLLRIEKIFNHKKAMIKILNKKMALINNDLRYKVFI
jgi:hypothetical protein